MGSWVSHFRQAPAELTVLGMNAAELSANEQARHWVVHDLNEEPQLPFPDGVFDDVVCCVSVDYLVRPLEVFEEVARVLRPGGTFVCTFSNRLFASEGHPAGCTAHRSSVGDRGHVLQGLGPVV